MTILSTRKMICDKINQEFDTILQPVEAAKATIKSQINQAKSKLSLMEFSAPAEINNAVTNLASDVAGIVPNPNTEDINEMLDFIKSCDFLDGHDILNNPISLLKGGVSSAISEATGFVDDLTELLPEYDVGQILGNILDKFSGAGSGLPDFLDITSAMQAADKIINCIAGRCGGDFSSRVISMTETLDELYSDLNIVSNPADPNWGKFDIDQFYEDASLSVQEKLQMDDVVNSIKDSQETITNSISSTVDATKSAARSVEGLF
jgi:hypothetical protein